MDCIYFGGVVSACYMEMKYIYIYGGLAQCHVRIIFILIPFVVLIF